MKKLFGFSLILFALITDTAFALKTECVKKRAECDAVCGNGERALLRINEAGYGATIEQYNLQGARAACTQKDLSLCVCYQL